MNAAFLLSLALLANSPDPQQAPTDNLPWWLDTAQRCADLKATERATHPRRAARHKRLLQQEAELIDAQLADTLTIRGRVTDASGQPIPGTTVLVKGTTIGASTAANGTYQLAVPKESKALIFSSVGYVWQEVKLTQQRVVDVVLVEDKQQLNEVTVVGYGSVRKQSVTGSVTQVLRGRVAGVSMQRGFMPYPAENRESYATIQENGYHDARRDPLSTFSIDVDPASYANVRRFLNNGQLPPPDAVRVEEMINYFHYDYPQPTAEEPFSVTMELAACPWNPQHQLVQVALQGRTVETQNLPPANLVFLVDVSGSMSSANKLPLVQAGLRELVRQLRPQDRVALVAYAGAAGLVLPPTPGNQPEKILAAIDNLSAGGSTAGGAGLRLAYRVARENFNQAGNNRVVLATDGDFNVGERSDRAMEQLITEERESGVFLTVLGVGEGNLQDHKMELLADKGSGNYAYLDNLPEAHRVLVRQFGGTLFTIAKDVKLQLEFNPARVQQYRLVGYENRLLAAEDFNNDRKDAGELGAGHTVTALYEVVPVGAPPVVDKLKYQASPTPAAPAAAAELLTVKLRYKEPQGSTSRLLTRTLGGPVRPLAQASENLRFAAAVAQFGMLLRQSDYRGAATYVEVARQAEAARGRDADGYRAEFIRLVRAAAGLRPEAYGVR